MNEKLYDGTVCENCGGTITFLCRIEDGDYDKLNYFTQMVKNAEAAADPKIMLGSELIEKDKVAEYFKAMLQKLTDASFMYNEYMKSLSKKYHIEGYDWYVKEDMGIYYCRIS